VQGSWAGLAGSTAQPSRGMEDGQRQGEGFTGGGFSGGSAGVGRSRTVVLGIAAGFTASVQTAVASRPIVRAVCLRGAAHKVIAE